MVKGPSPLSQEVAGESEAVESAPTKEATPAPAQLSIFGEPAGLGVGPGAFTDEPEESSDLGHGKEEREEERGQGQREVETQEVAQAGPSEEVVNETEAKPLEEPVEVKEAESKPLEETIQEVSRALEERALPDERAVQSPLEERADEPQLPPGLPVPVPVAAVIAEAEEARGHGEAESYFREQPSSEATAVDPPERQDVYEEIEMPVPSSGAGEASAETMPSVMPMPRYEDDVARSGADVWGGVR